MNPSPFIDVLRTVFPVIAMDPQQSGQIARPDFFGTAFAVAPGIFMTAAHVVNSAAANGQLALAGPVSGQPMMGAARVHRYELWPDRDIALLFSDAGDVTLLNIWLNVVCRSSRI